jgi:hypothetical protein
MGDDAENALLALLREQEGATARGDAKSAVAVEASDIVTHDLPPPLEYRGAGARAIDG